MSETLLNKIEILTKEITFLKEKLNNLDYNLTKNYVEKSYIKIIPQSDRMDGMITALCVDTLDIWGQNRIRFFCPLFHDPNRPTKSLPWASPISTFGGFDDSGATWIPPAGSTVCIIFEGGQRNSPFYLGTTWARNRGATGNRTWGIPIEEFDRIWAGHRGGYLVGENDESQVLPPWNTENYNKFDINSISDFNGTPNAQKYITYPNIFGFKTPEKHMLKMVDGDPNCNRKWKRLEIMSGCGNWLIMKDDHLHYSGQWAHPSCGARPGDVSCVPGVSSPTPVIVDSSKVINNLSANNNVNIEILKPKELVPCVNDRSNPTIIGGHPDTPDNILYNPTPYQNQQVGANPFFKHASECRPYRGPGTPQNNKAALPQTGFQVLSISGHTIIMDDSVQEPRGAPEWERGTKDFDFGCNNTFMGKCIWKTATGHTFEMSDIETENSPGLRSEDNFIRLLTASGNMIELNDHTKGASVDNCTAGDRRGITMITTSNNTFQMIDAGNQQCSPFRKEGGKPTPNSSNAFIKFNTGYGLTMQFQDDNSQQNTQRQYIQIYSPQKDNQERGPHILRMQESPSGPGQIFLRAGGDYIVSTNDNMVDMVGDINKSPSDKIENISRDKCVYVKNDYINVANNHTFVANNTIMLLAGKDCGDTNQDPCPAPVLVWDNGCIKISDRVFASVSKQAPKASIFMLDPLCVGNIS